MTVLNICAMSAPNPIAARMAHAAEGVRPPSGRPVDSPEDAMRRNVAPGAVPRVGVEPTLDRV